MQAKLPDINAALVTHRKAALNAYDRGDYAKAAIAFQDIIALLPDEYKVEINTEKYNRLIQKKKKIICDECKEAFERSQIIPYELTLSNLDSLILQVRTALVWECPKCKNVRPLEGSNTQTVMFEAPYYFKVIPEPPRRRGLEDRQGYLYHCKKWYEAVFKEIESQIGRYRADYAAQQDSDDDKGKGGGEELDE